MLRFDSLSLVELALAAIVLAAPALAEPKQQVLYSFCAIDRCPDGEHPRASLIADQAGNLYGTTFYGGTDNRGVVFKLTPGVDGTWTETVLYMFGYEKVDGVNPAANLVFDGVGDLYGTTTSGNGPHPHLMNSGTAFELSPKAIGGWKEKLLYTFCAEYRCADGKQPAGGLIMDRKGNLYGVTAGGGSRSNRTLCEKNGCGVAFELSPDENGTWTESVLYTFCSARACSDGAYPNGSLVFDSGGSLYGVTSGGGIFVNSATCEQGCGTVFKLTPGESGTWSETVLHRFKGTDGSVPSCSPIFDSSGNLYCTASSGGAYNGGVAFQLSPEISSGWTYKVIADFGSGNRAPDMPSGGLVLGSDGDLYGAAGGGPNGVGAVYRLTPEGGQWKETTLHDFTREDGRNPNGPLLDFNGVLYGTTLNGGTSYRYDSDGNGTAFEIIP
jgi:uncharacterized repeat protein (TIGR03803 family)